ncbi:MAG TPA: hypothetical protein VIM57_01770 [Luteolibacter sp.]
MKIVTANLSRIFLILIGIAVLVSQSGCISIASVGHSGKRLVDLSHKADALQSAYVLPDGNIVVFVSGRLSKQEGKADFSLLVPKEALLKIKKEKKAAYASKSGYRTMCSYDASIGPSSDLKLEGWRPLKTDRERRPYDPGAPGLEFDDSIPPQNAPVIYAMDRAAGASNEKGLKGLWGEVQLVYVDTYPDGTVFRCEIIPKAERIEKTRNGLAWLPVTVPLDVATLPAQTLWGALFVLISAGEAVGNR